VRWQEIDIGKKTWTIPPKRTKAGQEHRVSLSTRAVAVLREMKAAAADGDYVFPGKRPGGPLSNLALEMFLRRAQIGIHDARLPKLIPRLGWKRDDISARACGACARPCHRR
jgi:integrase